MQSEDTWMELHVLHDHGWSIAALAREFGLDWRTAGGILLNGEGPPRAGGGSSIVMRPARRCEGPSDRGPC